MAHLINTAMGGGQMMVHALDHINHHTPSFDRRQQDRPPDPGLSKQTIDTKQGCSATDMHQLLQR